MQVVSVVGVLWVSVAGGGGVCGVVCVVDVEWVFGMCGVGVCGRCVVSGIGVGCFLW